MNKAKCPKCSSEKFDAQLEYISAQRLYLIYCTGCKSIVGVSDDSLRSEIQLLKREIEEMKRMLKK